MLTRITPNTDTFYVVTLIVFFKMALLSNHSFYQQDALIIIDGRSSFVRKKYKADNC